MSETTGEETTGPAAPGPGAGLLPGTGTGVLSDGDLPTRMLVFGVARHDGSIPAVDAFAVADARDAAPLPCPQAPSTSQEDPPSAHDHR